jgi:predicted dehydrogenase
MWKAQYLVKDFRELVSRRDQFQAILILTPTPTHFEVIKSCIEHDIPVITEKSMTRSYEQGLKIYEIFRESSKLFVTFNYTGYPMVRELKKRVEKHHYGKIHSVHVEMLQDSFGTLDEKGNPKRVQDWRLVDYEIPTVSLDLGVHVINLLEFVIGNTIDKVTGVESHVGLVSRVVDNIHALGVTATGTSCRLSYGKTFPGKKNGLRISLYGSQGAAHWTQESPNELIESDSKGRLEILNYSSPGIIEASKDRYMRFKTGHPIGFIEAFANLYEDIFLSLKEEKSQTDFTFGVDEALSGLATLTALHESSALGSWVSVADKAKKMKL